jgi:hypothetical protein
MQQRRRAQEWPNKSPARCWRYWPAPGGSSVATKRPVCQKTSGQGLIWKPTWAVDTSDPGPIGAGKVDDTAAPEGNS